jgi:D-alanine-D-alanine ligase
MLNIYKKQYKETQAFIKTHKIVLVANVREKTARFSDYKGTSVISEYLTIIQYELIIDTLRERGYEVTSYFDENDFIHDCIKDDYFRADYKQTIVINTAQKGIAIGRKSLIPSFCDMNGLLHTNSNAYAVSLTRNKFHCDSILKSNSFPVTEEFLFMPTNGWFQNKKPAEGSKMIAKLNGETSSIGMTSENIFIYENEKDSFIESLAKTYRQPVIVQDFIEGYEVEVPVIIDGTNFEVILPVGISVSGKRELNDVILDYSIRKNLEFDFYNYSKHNKMLSDQLEECSKQVLMLLGIEGFGRVDFRIDRNNNFFITDVAANPHLTKGMSFNYAFTENDMNYSDMLETLIEVNINRSKKENAKLS